MPPAHWPPSIVYSPAYVFHSSVPPDQKAFILGKFTQPDRGSSNRAPVIIKPVKAQDHPAFGQHGLFASRKIPPKTLILYYTGEVHSDDRPQSNYDLSLYRAPDGSIDIGIDATRIGNEARFVNDYRGVRDRPNAKFVEERHGEGQLQMAIMSSNEVIKKGEEIVVSYGKQFWKTRGGANEGDSLI